MSIRTINDAKKTKKGIRKLVDAALEETGGLLSLAPAWVPRSFLQPGKRLKLHPDDLYAYGLNRGGIDERWFASTTVTAKELTIDPGTTGTIKDTGAYGLICVQGMGTINGQPLNSPKLIRFEELTEDEYFRTEAGAKAGVTFENTSETEPIVCLRYFGPEVNKNAPEMGAYRKNTFK
ncbi:hypothetical protein N9B94_01575 [Verrucomicrobia bacterium]|nr:hypothetical protein [Verrucomicrobiota bacterium]